MVLTIVIVAILAITLVVFRYAKRPTPAMSEKIVNTFEPPPNARPLFTPSDKELRQESAAELSREIALRKSRTSAELSSRVDKAINDWRSMTDARNAAELLAVAAAGGRHGDFDRAAGEILGVFRKSGIPGLSASDVAALIDSHYRLLPAEERSSGALFWLKEEVARLRSE
jgi:hypothetical protein